MLLPLRPLLIAALLLTTTACAAATPPKRNAIDFHRWDTRADFTAGSQEGTVWANGGLRIAQPLGVADSPTPGGPGYEFASWTSPVRQAASGATQLVPSWNASTPPGSWLQVEMRAHAGEKWTPWLSFGRWASGDGDIQRASINGQHGIDTDTYSADPGTTLTEYQLKVTLYRAVGASSPSLTNVGAMTSAIPDRFGVPPSGGGQAWGRELPVPRYSQNVHTGDFPQYGGGGESWCSPTSTEMVVEYWGRGPTAADMAWIPSGHADPTVDQAARASYDSAYQGTGNWPFNAAYAGALGLDAHVTRLDSLTAAESYVAMGIPVITSLSFRAGEIDGADYDTDGHLMVIVGFTATGDVIVNDPASSSDAAVRHVYPRAQFENAWLRTKRRTADGKVADASGGIVYIITPPGHPQPTQ